MNNVIGDEIPTFNVIFKQTAKNQISTKLNF